jgi:hypothetical protein
VTSATPLAIGVPGCSPCNPSAADCDCDTCAVHEVFAADVSALHDDMHFVTRRSSYRGEHGLPLIDIKAATEESAMHQ